MDATTTRRGFVGSLLAAAGAAVGLGLVARPNRVTELGGYIRSWDHLTVTCKLDDPFILRERIYPDVPRDIRPVVRPVSITGNASAHFDSPALYDRLTDRLTGITWKSKGLDFRKLMEGDEVPMVFVKSEACGTTEEMICSLMFKLEESHLNIPPEGPMTMNGTFRRL